MTANNKKTELEKIADRLYTVYIASDKGNEDTFIDMAKEVQAYAKELIEKEMPSPSDFVRVNCFAAHKTVEELHKTTINLSQAIALIGKYREQLLKKTK